MCNSVSNKGFLLFFTDFLKVSLVLKGYERSSNNCVEVVLGLHISTYDKNYPLIQKTVRLSLYTRRGYVLCEGGLYTCIHTLLYTYVHIDMCVRVCLHVDLVCVYIYISMSMLCMYIYIYMCICVCVCPEMSVFFLGLLRGQAGPWHIVSCVAYFGDSGH